MTNEFDLEDYIKRGADRLDRLAQDDPQISRIHPLDAVTASIQEPGISYREIIARTLAGYAERPAIGVRGYDVVADAASGEQARKYLPSFRMITYADLARQVEAIANCWMHDPTLRMEPGERVAYIAFNGAEMFALDLATNYAQTVGVPLQANLPAQTMLAILSETTPATLVASIDSLALAVEYAGQQDSIRSLIVIDADERVDADRASIVSAGEQLAAHGGRVTLATFDKMVETGSKRQFVPLPDPVQGRDHMSLIMYTSGSTGTPKGAIIHDEISTQFWAKIANYSPVVTVAYAPLNHFFGRIQMQDTLARGGTVYCSLRSDMSTLLEDIRLARPTYLALFPRVCELVYQHYMSEKQRRMAEGQDPEQADADVRVEMRQSYLGDRLCSAAVGSAPTAPEVRRFIAECFDIPMFDGYGITEGGAAGITIQDRVNRGMVIDYKLVDVPELSYYTTDKPYPRGELLVKTNVLIQGYYNRPDATAAIFDEEGYLKTGDIMEERGPDHIAWIDRRNNVIKLSQAEFVAIGPLEVSYLGNSKIIKQIYLYGNSYRSFLLAVVVPDVEIAAKRLGREPTDADLRELALADVQEIARTVGLKSFEVPRDVLIEREPFTLENGLLSSVRKPLRPNLKQRYGDALEAMYEAMDRKQREELAMLRSAGDASTAERVASAFKVELGLDRIDVDDPQSFSDLGGDSFGAVGLNLLLEDMFSVDVPVSFIMHPDASVQNVAQYVDDAAASGDLGVGQFKRVHPDSEAVHASELQLEAFFDAEVLAAATKAPPPVDDVRTILLTGANGFLGRFLCLEWLEYAAKVDGKLICLIRGANADAARRRLDQAFGSLDPDLTEHFRDLASRHLEMIAGDLASPLMGLDAETFHRLAEEVDHIVHPAALVNHRMSYRNLFEPNVRGTAELIRLALTKRQKRFDYVSTLAVPLMSPELARDTEDMDVRIGAKSFPLDDMYASGYGASKWAGEVLLREAHDMFDLPVNVFRADMIMPHSRYHGQFNESDMFTRLLFSLVVTGLAPKSFYELEADGSRPHTHYDGLPVDFIAAAMQQLGGEPYGGYHSYNIANTHYDDGISLDTVVEWVISAGYDLRRIDDHGEWVQRFSEKMRNLPDAQRQQSSLSIMGHLEHPDPGHSTPVSSARFEAAVRRLPAGPHVPQLTERYIHKYLHDLHLAGLITLPERAMASVA